MLCLRVGLGCMCMYCRFGVGWLDARGVGFARLRLGGGYGGGIAWLVLVYCIMVGWVGDLRFGDWGDWPWFSVGLRIFKSRRGSDSFSPDLD
mgnify:CR=1 FL=1